jgi:CheY-like chemotaxis protein
VGKSRLANTLAFAGARGAGEWMGYLVKRRFRTLVLQSENGPRRIQSEVAGLPREWDEHVRLSLPTWMRFGEPAFRQELRRLWESWPFDVLIVDNMNDVAKADGREDFLEALDNIRASLPVYPDAPAVVVVAHLRKSRGGAAHGPGRAGRVEREFRPGGQGPLRVRAATGEPGNRR